MPEGPRELRLVLTAPDYHAALRFYRDVLGLREEASFADENGGRASLLHAGRATVELADDAHAEAIDQLEVGRRVAGPVRIAFEVVDAVAMTDRLVAAGATLVAGATRTPWGSLNARLDGPAGQQLTVYSNDIYVTERPRLDGQVVLAEPDPSWTATAADLIRDIRAVLGTTALVAEHVGSTSIPGLPAKLVIDLVLGVPDATDEASYVAALEGEGYHLHLREPEWHEHRLLKHTDPVVNLHVFAADSVEIDRMVAFRDHLRRDAADRDLYLRRKRELAGQTWAYTQDYADAKSDVVADIMVRAMSSTTSAEDHADVVALELSLLTPAVRSDADRVRELLHPDFSEFGASGRRWDTASVVDALVADPAAPSGEPRDLVPVSLAEDVVLLTYRLVGQEGGSLRSSVWVRDAGEWRVRFHQGTPAGG